MRWLHKLRMQMRMVFQRGKAGARLNDELQFHLEQQIQENVAKGMSADEARHAAMRSFGNPAALRDQSRETWSWNWLEQCARDVRIGVRTLARTPGFVLVGVLVMAFGIGANVALFTVVRSVLLRPLPFKNPDKLIAVYDRDVNGHNTYSLVAPGDFYDWQKETHNFEQMALWNWSGFNMSGNRDELPEFVDAGGATWNLFSTLGVPLALGRSFTEVDDHPDANLTTILTWSFFKRRFNADPAAIGKTIRLNSRLYTIIGVLPEWFSYPDPKIQLWVPFQTDFGAVALASHGNHFCRVVARLKAGISTAQATQEVNALQHQIHVRYTDQAAADGVDYRLITDSLVWDVKTPLYVLLASVGCLLLISCLNFSNLLVARGLARRKEIAIRTALGSSRSRLYRAQIIESLLVCFGGALVGMVLAVFTTHWLVTHWHGMPRAEVVQIDWVVVLFVTVITCFAGIVAGLIPAFYVTKENTLYALSESSRSATGGAARASLRKSLLVVEVALTVVLLICAGLLFRSFLRMQTSDPGCATQNVLTMRYFLHSAKYVNTEQTVAFHTKLLERVRHLPGVVAAGLTNEVPCDGFWGEDEFRISEHPPLSPGQHILALFRTADPAYFSAMQIPLVKGRFFTEEERMGNDKFVIITRAFAREFFPNEEPIGKHIHMDWRNGSADHEIIGIVGDTLYSLKEHARPMMYFPILTGRIAVGGDATLVVRSQSHVETLALPIQKAIAQIDPDLPVTHVLTMEQIIGENAGNANFTASLVLLFAGLSLSLAAIGLYGVLSYLVAQRTTEIGIRIALGAQRDQVMGLVLRDGLAPAVAGLILGLVMSVGVTRLMRSMLYEVSPFDPAVFVLVILTLLFVAAAACAFPAWRASRLDPMQALRTE